MSAFQIHLLAWVMWLLQPHGANVKNGKHISRRNMFLCIAPPVKFYIAIILPVISPFFILLQVFRV